MQCQDASAPSGLDGHRPAEGLRCPSYVWWLLLVGLVIPGLAGCQTIRASQYRGWKVGHERAPRADIRSDGRVRIENVRNFRYPAPDAIVANYDDWEFHMDQVKSVDFLVSPFENSPSLAHTMLSFGLDDGRYLTVSVEARLEEDETYSPWRGVLGEYELLYVLGDERDLVPLRTEHRGADVYLYATTATPEAARGLLRDILERVNELDRVPELYDSLTNNCTTNLARHINQLDPGRIPLDVRLLLPGFSDRLAFDRGLLVNYGSFAETRRRAHINERSEAFAHAPDYSLQIRR